MARRFIPLVELAFRSTLPCTLQAGQVTTLCTNPTRKKNHSLHTCDPSLEPDSCTALMPPFPSLEDYDASLHSKPSAGRENERPDLCRSSNLLSVSMYLTPCLNTTPEPMVNTLNLHSDLRYHRSSSVRTFHFTASPHAMPCHAILPLCKAHATGTRLWKSAHPFLYYLSSRQSNHTAFMPLFDSAERMVPYFLDRLLPLVQKRPWQRCWQPSAHCHSPSHTSWSSWALQMRAR